MGRRNEKICGKLKSEFLVIFVIMLRIIFGSRDASGATAIDGFDPNAEGYVYSIAIQSDGKILVKGIFTLTK